MSRQEELEVMLQSLMSNFCINSDKRVLVEPNGKYGNYHKDIIGKVREIWAGAECNNLHVICKKPLFKVFYRKLFDHI